MRIHRHRHQKPKLNIPTFRVNEQIDNPEIRVIDDKGEQLGVIPTSRAMEIARERELDLVEVSPKAEPPVCKILDFGHFKYQKEKEVRKQKAQSHEVEIKGIRLSLRIGDHDLEIRHQQAKKFFERGDKVKIELRLRGREKAHVDVAKEVVAKFLELVKADFPIRVEQPIQVMGGTITMVLARG
ncbi:translation initiation factor IF-3 [bacterium]|nr:translation initiation factor IF-3 [bacterium]